MPPDEEFPEVRQIAQHKGGRRQNHDQEGMRLVAEVQGGRFCLPFRAGNPPWDYLNEINQFVVQRRST